MSTQRALDGTCPHNGASVRGPRGPHALMFCFQPRKAAHSAQRGPLRDSGNKGRDTSNGTPSPITIEQHSTWQDKVQKEQVKSPLWVTEVHRGQTAMWLELPGSASASTQMLSILRNCSIGALMMGRPADARTFLMARPTSG
eukprot:1133840-Alexandrium_andersonii.AAC.1